MSLRALIISAAVCFIAQDAVVANQAFLSLGQPTSAVDARGIRHSVPSGKRAPWLDDRLKAVAPEYPYDDRAKHHVGLGVFHLALDLKTGVVTRISVAKSTGFSTLDRAAIIALRQWRWRPGRWAEIELPVTFTMQQRYVPPRGSLPLPTR